jgi:two-component system cell cycle sensor histidine kinase/response regulator CckA
VLDAKNGLDGLSTIRSHDGPIDILISDVLMPEMNGGVLMERALALRPSLRVLLVSGHPEDVLVREGVSKGVPFLQKPFTPAELALRVRDILDSKNPG